MPARLGTMFRDLGRREDAIAEYRRAITLDADQAILHALIGAMLSDTAQNDVAKSEFRRALELDPKLPAELGTFANSLIDQASLNGSADLANAALLDACWMLVTASQLAPANDDYSTMMRQLDRKCMISNTVPHAVWGNQ